MNEYQVYVLYRALKMHFTSDKYDFIQYNGRTNGDSGANYDKRTDKKIFHRISKKYNTREIYDLFIVGMLNDPNRWIGEFLSSEVSQEYFDFLKRKQSRSYTFQEDIHILFENVKEPLDIAKIYNGQNPIMLSMTYSHEINLETLMIIEDITGIFKYFDAQLSDKIMWPKMKNKIQKYKTFMDYDSKKCTEILKKQLVV